MRLSIARWSPFSYMLPNVLWLQSSQKEWQELELSLDRVPAHLEGAVESSDFGDLILHHFASIWCVWGGSDQDMRRQWFLNQFALLRNKQNRFRERRKWSHCASWSAWCGALNGSPVDDTIWDPSVTIQCKKNKKKNNTQHLNSSCFPDCGRLTKRLGKQQAGSSLSRAHTNRARERNS